MPAFNFQKQFAKGVALLLKRQTIRAKRKNRPRVGQTAYCYTGMRTTSCTWLGEWVIKQVVDVLIMPEGVLLNGGALKHAELDPFARADGFEDFGAMVKWFGKQHGLPFRGDLVMW